MKLTRRQLLVTGLVGVLSIGFWLVTVFVANAAMATVIEAVWLVAGWLAGWRLFRDPPPAETERPPLPEDRTEAVIVPILEVAPEPNLAAPAVAPSYWKPFGREIVEALKQIETSAREGSDIQTELLTMSGQSAFIRENAEKAFEIADNLAGSAQHAFALSEKVQSGVTVVTNALVESLKQAEVLSEHSARITGILELMSEVSDKIHVLSINASIVSARAGTAGRAFEVVAKEIRSLAKETEHSLGDIVEVIEFLRSSIAKVIQVVRDADVETEQEKSSLIEVAGALQGVILGVEIVKAVSGFAKEKALEQDQLSKDLAQRQAGQSRHWIDLISALRTKLEEEIAKE